MVTTALLDPFEVLGLPRDTSADTIKARYHMLARRYHPNRLQGRDDSKTHLSNRFHAVHQSWKLLRDPQSRRRYVELLDLIEHQDTVISGITNLSHESMGRISNVQPSHEHDPGYVSSDADDDCLPHVGLNRRKTVLEQTMSGSKRITDVAHDTKQQEPESGFATLYHRIKANNSAFHLPALLTENHENGDKDYFALRRKKLEKLRRREAEFFLQYRNTMLAKFEAELEVERAKEQYEQIKWKREYFERAPRETAERLRSLQHYLGAAKAFEQHLPRRRDRVGMSDQIVSTDERPNQNQFLSPNSLSSPVRRTSLHRRGWSTDVSGDQTSSDEMSNTDRGSRQFPEAWKTDQRPTQQVPLALLQPILKPVSLPSSGRRISQENQKIFRSEPFKVVLKRPTDSVGAQDPHVSNPDSRSGSSRSPSPSVGIESSLHNFTLRQHSRVSEFLNAVQNQDTLAWLGAGYHSSILDNHHDDSKASYSNSSLSSIATPSFYLKQMGRPRFEHLSIAHVRLLGESETSWFLDANANDNESPTGLLKRLSKLDAGIAERFMVKPDMKRHFKFRLIYNQSEASKNETRSFVAMSYRRKRHVEKSEKGYSLPLEANLFQAVMDERCSDAEGLWIDQICIDQESQEEKTISMSAMDLVYRSARLAVVVLDDIILDAQEAETLQQHMNEYEVMTHVPSQKRFRRKQPPFLATNRSLYNVIRKLLRSSWFRRAWCRHEMRLAPEHVFLVPCQTPGAWSGQSVIRLTSHCLTHLLGLATETTFERSVEKIIPPLHAFFRQRSTVTARESLGPHDGNFTTVIAEVLAMDAGGDPSLPLEKQAADALKDKISIILNAMDCGLALQPRMRLHEVDLTKWEAQYMLLILALAARDPGALASVGPPMCLTRPDSISPTVSTTWLFEPTNIDSGLNNHKTLRRIGASIKISTHVVDLEHYVQLDMVFMQGAGKIARIDERSEAFKLAKHILAVCEKRQLGRNRDRYLLSDLDADQHFGSMRDVYIQTVACVIECGPGWMEEVCHRYGVSRWRQDMQPAYELLVALKSTDDRWPENAWNSRGAGFIMDFANFMISRGMPQRQIVSREAWRPLLVRLEHDVQVLTFVPEIVNICTAIPLALWEPEYIHLARLWVLQPREYSPHIPTHEVEMAGWTLLGKSVLFGNNLTARVSEIQRGDKREQQKVFGRDHIGNQQ